ncbi:MAG: hypothetical protein HDR90_02685 [Bacteroides sp.]|nr:hypothetical protein [Bacteroides sp.]
MLGFIWAIIGFILQFFGYLSLISLVIFFFRCLYSVSTNGGRKWYYYNPSKPWKGGYWSPLLPDYPPYNEYEWNPETCRFEHKVTGKPLHSWQKPYTPSRNNRNTEWDWDSLAYPEEKPNIIEQKPPKKRPEWIRFLLEENIASLLEKRRQRKLAKKKETHSHR